MKRLLPLALAVAPLAASAQTSVQAPISADFDDRGPTVVRTVRLPSSPRIDGDLSDAAWASAPAYEGFRRVMQNEGLPSGQRTVMKIGYDAEAVYVAAWLYDTAPDSISSRLFRRDEGDDGESDRFIVFFDTFRDRRTAYGFGVNAAGSILDVTYANDQQNGDGSWDGVWEGKAGRFDGGWTAEMRIPFSQLRFARQDVQTWGVNAFREIQRTREFSMLRYLREADSGFISGFPTLEGIEGVRPGLGFEVTPYATSRVDVAPSEAGNPFFNGTRARLDVGADLKARLTSNLTLSATVNPDFGQVEVDPAEVNLTAFETFYQEKRPFFVEGASVFEFGAGPGGSTGFGWSNVNPFYSRRIGRAPQGGLPPHAFADLPESTRILGAAKLTGRLGETSVGMLSSVTGRMSADVLPSAGAATRTVEIEPLAHYGVVRALRAFDRGRGGVGVVGTATNRLFDDAYPADANLRSRVNESAYAAGVDGWQTFDQGRWILKGWAMASQVNGTADRIAALQRTSAHYLQRPDREAYRYDPTRTSLTGWATRVQFLRNGAPWFGNVAFGAISPTFDVNDLGFIGRTDVINAHVFGGYVSTTEGRFTRRRQVMASLAGSNTFDGDAVSRVLWTRANFTLRNYGFFGIGGNLMADGLDPYRTRGGPLMINKGGAVVFANVQTDSRKPYQFEFEVVTEQAEEITMWSWEPSVSWQPRANVRVSLGPEVSHSRSKVQWVRNQPDALMTATYGTRYVFADIDQWQANANLRLNWTFSPTMSLQLFAQPLVASGDYSGYKELARPRAYAFTPYTASEANGRVTVDPDGAGGTAPAFSFSNPDFRIASLRGNAVFRWEYRPGSTLFLVWTQNRSGFEPDGRFLPGEAASQLWSADAEHVFAVKATYWFGR